MESSVVEQADSGTVAVCGGAGAAGADGADESECVARTLDIGAWTFDECASGACDAGGFTFEDEYDAQARKHGPVGSHGTSVTKNEVLKRAMQRVTQR